MMLDINSPQKLVWNIIRYSVRRAFVSSRKWERYEDKIEEAKRKLNYPVKCKLFGVSYLKIRKFKGKLRVYIFGIPVVKRDIRGSYEKFYFCGIPVLSRNEVERRILGLVVNRKIPSGKPITAKFDYIISLGENNHTAITLRNLGLRAEAFPFDWCETRSPEIAGEGGFAKKIDLMCEGFDDEYEERNYEELLDRLSPNYRVVWNKKTGLQLAHEFPKGRTISEYFPIFYKKYRRSVDRLHTVLRCNASILFVFIEFSAQLDDKEIISAYRKLSRTYPQSRLHFLIIKNNTEMQKWALGERELTPNISLFYINNDSVSDKIGDMGNKELYRRIISDFANNHFVDTALYNRLFSFEVETTKSLSEIKGKSSPLIYRDKWEKDYLKRHFEDFDPRKYGDKISKLLENLDDESATNVQNVISRLNLLKKYHYADIDIFSEAESKELHESRYHWRDVVPLKDDLFYSHGCYLPEHHFNTSVFVKQLNIPLLEKTTVQSLRNTDFIDVGAFIGDSAFILNKLAPRSIYAFEALPRNYELMNRTIELNHLDDVVIPVNSALGDTTGEVFIQDESACSSIQKDSQSGEKVAMTTLDAFVEAHPEINVGLIKVDIEGAEDAFLKGAVNTIRKFRPVLLLSIYHNISDFLNLKTEVEKLDLGYTFKISPPDCGRIVLETNLIAYVDDHQ